MKKLYLIFTMVLFVTSGLLTSISAQAPEGLTYQAEARDNKGNHLVNKTLTVKTSILLNLSIEVWQAEYPVSTDVSGMFTIIIGDLGSGTNVSGDFSGINWGEGDYYLNVQILYKSNWIDMGTTQLLSVPYALYAKNAGSAANEADPVFSQWDKSTGIAVKSLQVIDFQSSVTDNDAVKTNTAKNSYPAADASKLAGIADGAEVNVNADWNAVSGDAQILNKPTLSTIATSGKYQDLSGIPDLSIYATKNMGNKNISNLADPVNVQDAATKAYVDKLLSIIQTIQNGMRDFEGNTYKVVLIGNQLWMAENLKTTTYNDGSNIPNVTDNSSWAALTTSAYCWHNNDINNKNTYGALYNWYVVNTGKLCPAGWHVPSDAEWTTLTTYLGGVSVAGGKMKSTTGWENPNYGATNESGFSGLPGGGRLGNGGFYDIGDGGYWWSSTDYSSDLAWYRGLYYSTPYVYRNDYSKGIGFSVRCLRD